MQSVSQKRAKVIFSIKQSADQVGKLDMETLNRVQSKYGLIAGLLKTVDGVVSGILLNTANFPENFLPELRDSRNLNCFVDESGNPVPDSGNAVIDISPSIDIELNALSTVLRQSVCSIGSANAPATELPPTSAATTQQPASSAATTLPPNHASTHGTTSPSSATSAVTTPAPTPAATHAPTHASTHAPTHAPTQPATIAPTSPLAPAPTTTPAAPVPSSTVSPAPSPAPCKHAQQVVPPFYPYPPYPYGYSAYPPVVQCFDPQNQNSLKCVLV